MGFLHSKRAYPRLKPLTSMCVCVCVCTGTCGSTCIIHYAADRTRFQRARVAIRQWRKSRDEKSRHF